MPTVTVWSLPFVPAQKEAWFLTSAEVTSLQVLQTPGEVKTGHVQLPVERRNGTLGSPEAVRKLWPRPLWIELVKPRSNSGRKESLMGS